MRQHRLISGFFTQGSSSRTPALIGLLAGLATGAVLGVLFATDSGRNLRESLLGPSGNAERDCQKEQQPAAGLREQSGQKRPKSDIKSLIHQAHTGEGHTEQELNA